MALVTVPTAHVAYSIFQLTRIFIALTVDAPSLVARRLINRAARKGSLGSLAPFVRPVLTGVPHMPKLRAALTPAPVVVLVTSAKLDTLLTERLEVAAKIAQLTARKEKIDGELLAATRKRAGEQGKIETSEFTVRDAHGVNEYIHKADLIKNGVRASVIEKSTTKTPYSYPDIRRKKAEVPA